MLEYQAHHKYLVFQNENANLVTALPYLDEKLENPAEKQRVMDLIKQEMRTMDRNKDYLEKLPLPKFDHLVNLH